MNSPILVETLIEDCFQIMNIPRFYDSRGFFQEIYNNAKYDFGEFKQVNWSFSKKDVLRGIHCADYGKLVTVVSGKIYDVVVDLRKNSPTYKKWASFVLSLESPIQLYVPAGCGHSFVALEDSMVVYMQNGIYDGKEKNYNWKSKELDIKWFIDDPIVSVKDSDAKHYES